MAKAFTENTIAVSQPNNLPPDPARMIDALLQDVINSGRCLVRPEALPYIYTSWVKATAPQLLSIADQGMEISLEKFAEFIFPWKLAIYDVTKWREQCDSGAYVNGILLEGVPNKILVACGGLTPRDRKVIQTAVLQGQQLEDIWRYALYLYETRNFSRRD